MVRYVMLKSLSDDQLVNVVAGREFDSQTIYIARLLLGARNAYRAGDYYSAAEFIAAMKGV